MGKIPAVKLPCRKYAITIEDVKGYMEENDIEVKPEEPTAFLFRTGMIKYFHKKDESYGGDAAGLTWKPKVFGFHRSSNRFRHGIL